MSLLPVSTIVRPYPLFAKLEQQMEMGKERKARNLVSSTKLAKSFHYPHKRQNNFIRHNC